MNSPTVITDPLTGTQYYNWVVAFQGMSQNVRIEKSHIDRMSVEHRNRILRIQISNAYHTLISRSINIV